MLVLGDGMADWLGYGLEDAYSDQPEIGVMRRHKTYSGLLKYQPKGEPADWAAAAKGILATEKPDAIVVMLGLNDRIAMREPAADKSDTKSSDAKSSDAKSSDAKSSDTSLPMPIFDGKSADGKTADKKTDQKDAKAKPDAKPADGAKPDAAAETRRQAGRYRVAARRC